MDIRISLDLNKSHEKYVYISYTISNISSDEIILNFPTWSPGSYLIREYESQVESFLATDPSGKKLRHQKISKCQWKILTKSNFKIRVSYRVYANDLNVRGIYADNDVVFINPTSAFFYIDRGLQLPARLSIKAPRKWTLALAKSNKGKFYSFQDFDELYDTPILCAKELKLLRFTVKNTRYRLALWGRHTGDIKKIKEQTQEIVRREIKIFKENPCRDYLFQILFVPKQFGGLEHSHCSTNIFDGSLLSHSKDYKRFLGLLSHEHFHLWNVKRIRPRELGPFDYTKEVYTRELWMAEGITSYYDDHALYRASVYSQEAYLELIAENITKLEANKSVHVNSISESSFDAWIRFYRQNENSINTVVSYYLKGGLVMMLLDFHIIQATKGKYTFDDVMHTLYKVYKRRPEVGFSREEFIEVAERIAKKSFKRFFANFIDGVKAIDWRKEFEPFGIEVKKKKKEHHNYLGVILMQTTSRVIVKAIAEDSPAYHSVLQPGDEIIAIEYDRLESLLQFDRYLTQDRIHVMYSRLGRVGELEIPLSGQARPTYQLKVKKKLRKTQKRFLARFLRR